MNKRSSISNLLAKVEVNILPEIGEITEKNALKALKEYVLHADVIAHAHLAKGVEPNNEWLLNEFARAAQYVGLEHKLEMAKFIANNEVFNMTAPKLYDTVAWQEVMKPLFSNNHNDSAQVLSAFENAGHMQGVVKAISDKCFEMPEPYERSYDFGLAEVFFNNVVRGLEDDEAIKVLEKSESFKLLQKSPMWPAVLKGDFTAPVRRIEHFHNDNV